MKTTKLQGTSGLPGSSCFGFAIVSLSSLCSKKWILSSHPLTLCTSCTHIPMIRNHHLVSSCNFHPHMRICTKSLSILNEDLHYQNERYSQSNNLHRMSGESTCLTKRGLLSYHRTWSAHACTQYLPRSMKQRYQRIRVLLSSVQRVNHSSFWFKGLMNNVDQECLTMTNENQSPRGISGYKAT